MPTLVVLSTPRKGEEEAMKSYVEAAVPMLIEAGGVPVKRLRVTHVVEGSPDTKFVFVADFDDVSLILEFFDGADYQALIPQRDRGFEAVDIFVTEDN